MKAIEKKESFQRSAISNELCINAYEGYANNSKWDNGKLVGRGVSKFGK